MRLSRQLLFVSILFGALLPATVWGYGFAAYPDDRSYLPYSSATVDHHYSGSLRLQTGMTEGGYYVHINLDGLRPEDIHVSLQRNNLVLQIAQGGQHGSYNPNVRGVSQWKMRYRRQLRLPYDADVTRMTTSTRKGTMEIYIPIVLPLKW